MRQTGTPNHAFLALSLVFAVFLWGGNNVGTKYILATWPPIWTGASRFLIAGLLLLLALRIFSPETGKPINPPVTQRHLWFRGGLSLALYIICFNVAVMYTAVSHVALYLAASPVWALLWEGWPQRNLATLKRYSAAGVALTGVAVLFWPSLQGSSGSWLGEGLGLAAGFLWTNYGRQCRRLSKEMSAPQVTACTMWRAGVLLMPLACLELFSHPLLWRWDIGAIHLYCIVAGGVVAFGLWNNALRHWRTSQVLLFNNLIPLSTTAWASVCLHEQITSRFWISMLLVLLGVALGQTAWTQLLAPRSVPPE